MAAHLKIYVAQLCGWQNQIGNKSGYTWVYWACFHSQGNYYTPVNVCTLCLPKGLVIWNKRVTSATTGRRSEHVQYLSQNAAAAVGVYYEPTTMTTVLFAYQLYLLGGSTTILDFNHNRAHLLCGFFRLNRK